MHNRENVPTNSPDWSQIEEVFLAAAELTGRDRAAYLDSACTGNNALRHEVESLLAAEEQGGGALTGAVNLAAESLGKEDLAGQRLGPWLLGEVIGQGGMGSVYLGVRADGQFEMRAAVKILRRGMETGQLLARFRYERQILAQLSHPGIAQLLDGGSTADGRPYLVMEYVDGKPLDVYSRECNLGIADRCRLFTKVCEAVSYAHRNLVVHRDLKPSNILVTADGSPRLLDFGIAKLLTREGAGDQTLTAISARPFTPDYASPEQILGQRVTTSSDVYSLGALLYQLLTGTKPHRLSTYTEEEVRKVATESQLERPSIAAVNREISLDLDNIVLMAMRREPERRYGSVDELRQDIERYLEGHPVVARDDTFGYIAGKFLRRNRVSVAAAAIVLASIMGGSLIAVREARIAAHQRDIAERERDTARRAQAVAEHEHTVAEQQFVEAGTQREKAEKRLGNLVELANRTLLSIQDQLERIPGATEPRKAIVSSTLAYLDKLITDAPDDRDLALAVASGYIRMGDVLGSPLSPNLGDTAGAQKSYEKALALLNRLGSGFEVSLRRFTAFGHIGSLHQEAGKLADAGKFYRLATQEAAKIPAPNREDEVYLNERANLHLENSRLQAKLSDKEGLDDAKLAVSIREKLAARYPGKEEYSQALSADYGNLSLLLMTAQRRDEAREVALKTIDARERNAARHPDDVLLKRDLMMGYGRLGDLTGGPFFGRVGGNDKAALEYYRKAVELGAWLVKADASNQLAGADHATALMRAGIVLPGPEAIPQSIEYLTQAQAILEETLKKNPKVRFVRASLGTASEHLARRYAASGRPAQAVEQGRKALAVAQGMVRDEPDYASARINVMSAWDALIRGLIQAGDKTAVAEAQRCLDAALDYAAHGPKPDRMRLFPPDSLSWLGDAYAAQGTAEELRLAKANYQKSLQGWRELLTARPQEAPGRIATAERKIADCDRAILALK